jgi:hypothetical protein
MTDVFTLLRPPREIRTGRRIAPVWLLGGLGVALFFTLVIGFTLYMTVGQLVLGHWREQQVLQHGLPAQAQIIGLADTGSIYNNDHVVAVTLEVMPPGQPPYQAVVDQPISVLNVTYFAPGNFVPVKYDPAHPDHVAFTFGPGHSGALPPSSP